MRWRHHAPRAIASKLREAERMIAAGATTAEAAQAIGVGRSTLARWKREFGDVEAKQIAEIKSLEKRNKHMLRMVMAYGAEPVTDNAHEGAPAEGPRPQV